MITIHLCDPHTRGGRQPLCGGEYRHATTWALRSVMRSQVYVGDSGYSTSCANVIGLRSGDEPLVICDECAKGLREKRGRLHAHNSEA